MVTLQDVETWGAFQVHEYLHSLGTKTSTVRDVVPCTFCKAPRNQYCDGPMLHATRKRSYLRILVYATNPDDPEGENW